MAQFDIRSLTAIGANDLARALNGERIIWDYMQASTDYFSNDVANLTTLTNVIKNLKILSAKQVADGQFDVISRISSTDVNQQTIIRTYGLFAHFNTETPALVAIISDKNGDALYPVSQATNPQDLQQTMSLVFPNPDGKPIPYVISNSGYAMDTEVLHTANDETATGTKTFQKIKISNDKFPNLVQTDGQSITLDGGTTELVPADDSKVVHSKDMRKPANDVAGIDEVNAKQDKIGYTPADDSKVVHDTDTSNWQKNKVTNDDGTPLIKLTSSNQDLSATLMSLSAGVHTVYANATVQNSPYNGQSSAKGVVDIQANATGSSAFGEGFLIGTKTNQGILMYHVWLDGSKANYTQIANDSKVAHLSGANNFDTTPTVNNNPLLLGSSLPADLARTSQQTNFTAGLQSGGVSVATSDDLKSVADSAWRVITSSNGSLSSITFLYKINSEGSYLDFMYTAVANSNPPSSTTIIADLSGVISGISRLDGCWINIGRKIEGTLSYSGTQIIINSSNFNSNNGDVVIGTGNQGTTGGASYETGRVYYTSLVNN